MATVSVTSANINDVTQDHALLHGEEVEVFADAGDPGGRYICIQDEEMAAMYRKGFSMAAINDITGD